MPDVVPPLSFLCISVLARFPHHLNHIHPRRIPLSDALLDALPRTLDPRLWAALAQLVHPLPPHLHDHDLPLSHPDLPLLQKIPHSPDFSLVTLVSLPNCAHLHDDSIANLRTLHHLLALDLHGCSISSYALTALARSLDHSTRTGPRGLRLLGLHGCPNVDDDVFSALHKFPLLSAIDLRFTRCTSSALNAHLSSLGFRPSCNNSLFHPAPLSLGLCTLERLAHNTPSLPVSLYSCPLQSVFRIHVDKLNDSSPQSIRPVTLGTSSTHQTVIRTIASSEDFVVFIPPIRGSEPYPPSNLSELASAVPVASTPLSFDQSTCSDHVSNISSFYENAPMRTRGFKTSILPFSAQAVQSSKGGKLDPLAVARSPPPWKTLESHNSPVLPNSDYMATRSREPPSDGSAKTRQKRPIPSRSGQALDGSLAVDRARLRKRGSDTVAEMVHQFASKRVKVKSEFSLAKTQGNMFINLHNPFARSKRSVFAESSRNSSGEPLTRVHEISKESESDARLRACHSLPSKLGGAKTSKTLKPITTFKPPILLKEWLPPSPRRVPTPRGKLKQTRLSFSREGEGDDDSMM